jgi:hypothetical protein
MKLKVGIEKLEQEIDFCKKQIKQKKEDVKKSEEKYRNDLKWLRYVEKLEIELKQILKKAKR